MRSPFQLVLKLFRDRFLENDTVSPGGGFQTNIYQLLGILATIGGFIVIYGVPAFLVVALRPLTPRTEGTLRSFQLFFAAYSFGIAGFAAIFHWDMLFPDRRDFLILAPFPIRLREIAGAKFTALIAFLSDCVRGGAERGSRRPLWLRWAAGHGWAPLQLAVTVGASIFAFLAVMAGQGILISVTSPRIFRRISPWIQMVRNERDGDDGCSGSRYTRPCSSAPWRRDTFGCICSHRPGSAELYELLLGGQNRVPGVARDAGDQNDGTGDAE